MSSRRPAHPGPPPDHYAVLGVPAVATAAQIKRAYRELAKSHHPDVNQSPSATRRFAQIAEAYAVLSDPAKRADHDRRVREHLSPPEPSRPVDTRAHYNWTNIAAQGSAEAEEANRASELDELYDTFFSPPPEPKPGPRADPGASAEKRNGPRAGRR